MNITYPKHRINGSTVAGVIPTIPASDNHLDGSWLDTDLYNRELFISTSDKKLYARTDNVITLINNTNFSALTNTPTTIFGYGLTDAFSNTGGTVSGSVSATTFYGDGSNLTGIATANYYTTGATLSGTIATFRRNDNNTYTIQLSGLTSGITAGGTSVFKTGSTGSYSIRANNDSTIDATGIYSLAAGRYSLATGDYSTALNIYGVASGQYSLVANYSNDASGLAASSLGRDNLASGDVSLAHGKETTAHDFCEITGGQWNVVGTGNMTSWVAADNLFTLGNGTSSGARTNAFQVKKNGQVKAGSSVAVGNDSSTASAALAGAMRYREDWDGSYFEVCMNINGDGAYEWTVIKKVTYP